MAKIEINKVELVWPGKYNDDGTLREAPRVSLPFQVIERVNESRATKEAEKQLQEKAPLLYQVWGKKEGDTFEEGWRNKLIWGDNLLVMGSLLEKFAGKIDLIYIDPPFATGADFSFKAPIGEGSDEVSKEQSIIEEKAYRDTWGRGINSYIRMLHDRLRLIHELLSPDGSLVVHVDYRVVAYVRCILDELFGRDNLRNEIVWFYKGGALTGIKRALPSKHDNLLWYTKGDGYVFNPPRYAAVSEQMLQRWGQYADSEGRITFGKIRHEGETYARLRRRYISEHGKEPPDDAVAFVLQPSLVRSVWDDIPEIRNSPRYVESTGFATQKPEALLERIIGMLTVRGALVADFFCGSGTTLAVAEKLGRRWIGCDLSRWAIHVTRKRLLDIEGCKPFEVLNLGKYERQYWQGVTFGDKKDKGRAEQVLYEYLAFMLRLYGAQPVAGMAHLHGKKGKAMVHIGAVDAPVTIDEINEALDECVKVGQKELHVLGWEWEMGARGPEQRRTPGKPHARNRPTEGRETGAPSDPPRGHGGTSRSQGGRQVLRARVLRGRDQEAKETYRTGGAQGLRLAQHGRADPRGSASQDQKVVRLH